MTASTGDLCHSSGAESPPNHHWPVFAPIMAMHWAIWRRLASFGIASLARQRGPARMLAIEALVTAALSGLRAAADEHRHQGGGITSDAGTCYGSIRSAGGRRAVACVV